MQSRFVTVNGLSLHLLEWPGPGLPFLLLHGLSSNARTWSQVAARLSAAGHHVVALDQRGHGRSDKPSSGYDFATLSRDLAALIAALGLDRPIVVGQSWGGNVVLDFAARYPEQVRAVAFVDGGFIDLHGEGQQRWSEVEARLRPPEMDGMARSELEAMLRHTNPDWSEEGIQATIDNFQTCDDGTIRRCLSIPNHMKILHALWEQRPASLYPQLSAPVLITVAGTPESTAASGRAAGLAAAETGLSQVTIRDFPHTHHDIHVHRPDVLADLFLETVARWNENRTVKGGG